MEPQSFFVTAHSLKLVIANCIQEALEKNLKEKEPEREILNLVEAANFLCISMHTLRKHAKLGLIARHLPDIRGYRFLRSELLKYNNYYRKN